MAINDFGEKIGGARKDLWSAWGMNLRDMEFMNDAERKKFVKKDNVWKRPDYQKMMDEGLSPRVAYFIKCVRDSLPTGPYIRRTDGPEAVAAAQERYVGFISDLRDAAMNLKQDSDIAGFYDKHIGGPYVTSRPGSWYVDIAPQMQGLIDNKVLGLKKMERLSVLDRAIRQKQFGYSDDQKLLSRYEFYQYDGERAKLTPGREGMHLEISVPGGTYFGYPQGEMADPAGWEKGTWFALYHGNVAERNAPDLDTLKQTILEREKVKEAALGAQKTNGRKGRFTPPQLEHVRFAGADYRGGRDITGEDYLNTFQFKGGEFGNWMGERDRQVSMNMGYESLCAMAKALNISLEDISLGGKLSIAFGARGQGAAAAHYEPMREVINLTKLRGAGSLAHEWGHAFDDILNKVLGCNDLTSGRRTGLTDIQKQLHEHMKYRMVEQAPAQTAQREKAERAAEQTRKTILLYLPGDSQLTPSQISTRDTLIDKALNDRSIHALSYDTRAAPPESLEALSEFRKSISGRVIPKDVRRDLARRIGFVNRSRELSEDTTPRLMRVPTQYMQDSVKFDEMFSKDGHGYWQSDIEMFARAFACYTHDKLREAGIRCDYAVGHSEAGPVPHGDERKVLNSDFDALIAEFKTRGLLHDYAEPERTATLEKAAGEREAADAPRVSEDSFGQLSLDDVIGDAQARASPPSRGKKVERSM